MKFYILTSSLNINTILSQERIAPQKDYVHTYYEVLPEFAEYGDMLFLFSVIPTFSIKDDERDNYPMVIEFDDDIQLNYETVPKYHSESCEVLFVDKSLYLTPWNCRILFFSDKARIMSSLAIKDSKCVKLEDGFLIENIRPKEITLSSILDDDLFSDCLKSRIITGKKDNYAIINITKGGIWGNILGRKKSVSLDSARLKQIQRRIYDIIASVMSNNGDCNPRFYEELVNLNLYFCDIVYCDDIGVEWNREYKIIERKLNELEVYSIAKRNFYKKRGVFVLPNIDDMPNGRKKKAWESYRDEMIKTIDRYIAQQKDEFMKIDKQIVVDDYRLNVDDEFINLVLNLIYNGELNVEKLRINRSDVVKKIASEIQNHLGETNWNNSSERKYLLSLYNNIENFEPFSLSSSQNIALISIAAFIMKGENYDDLMRYLEEEGVTDYSYVLTLWGALEGYESLSKGVFKSLLSVENVNFVNTQIWKEWKSYDTFPSHTKNLSSEVNGNAILNEKQASVVEFDSFFEKLQMLVGKKNTVLKDKPIYENLYNQFGDLSESFLNAVKNSRLLNSGKGVQKYVRAAIEKMLHEKKEERNNIDLFNGNKYFYNDDKAWDIIKDIVPDESKNKIEQDLKWFQGELQKPREKRHKYYQSIDENNNNNTIERFCRLKEMEKDGKPQAPYFTKELREQIKQRLLSHYVNR